MVSAMDMEQHNDQAPRMVPQDKVTAEVNNQAALMDRQEMPMEDNAQALLMVLQFKEMVIMVVLETVKDNTKAIEMEVTGMDLNNQAALMELQEMEMVVVIMDNAQVRHMELQDKEMDTMETVEDNVQVHHMEFPDKEMETAAARDPVLPMELLVVTATVEEDQAQVMVRRVMEALVESVMDSAHLTVHQAKAMDLAMSNHHHNMMLQAKEMVEEVMVMVLAAAMMEAT